MASAWQSVLSAHQGFVDNGGMMLMIILTHYSSLLRIYLGVERVL